MAEALFAFIFAVSLPFLAAMLGQEFGGILTQIVTHGRNGWLRRLLVFYSYWIKMVPCLKVGVACRSP